MSNIKITDSYVNKPDPQKEASIAINSALKQIEAVKNDIRVLKDMKTELMSEEVREQALNQALKGIIEKLEVAAEKFDPAVEAQNQAIIHNMINQFKLMQTGIESIESALKAVNFNPEYKPDIKIKNDLTGLEKQLDKVINAIKANANEIDLSKVEKELIKVNQTLDKILKKTGSTNIVGGGGSYNGPQTTHNDQFVIPVIDVTHNTTKYDYSSNTVIYVGEAPLGTAVNATGWTITKYDLTDNSDASGKVATDVSWNNKASGDYK